MTFSPERAPENCAYPPHPAVPAEPFGAEGQDQAVTQALVPMPGPDWSQEYTADSAPRRFGRWLRHAPAERVPLAAAPVVWTGAEIMHTVGVHGTFTGAAAAIASGIAYGIGEKHAAGSEHPRLRGAELAGITGAAGAWLTMATMWGPLAGWYDGLTTGGLAFGAIAYWLLYRHEALAAARARRDAAAAEAAAEAARIAELNARKATWHRIAAGVGLARTHLLTYSVLPNGSEEWAIDLSDARKLAESEVGRRLSAMIAGELGMRLNRVETRPDEEWPYRLYVVLRKSDLWQGGAAAGLIWHPYASGVYDPEAPWAQYVPEHPSVRDLVTFGGDPETGDPLQVPLWTPQGAERILVVATSRTGKSMTLDDLCERITATTDGRLLQINLSKGIEDAWWAPLAIANALASHPDPEGQALRVLDFAVEVIRQRPQWRQVHSPGVRVHKPTPAEPVFIVKVDEVDVVAADPERRAALEFIASKGGSEGVALVIAGQRPVNKAIGGPVVRANLSWLVWGKMRANDVRNAGGAEGEGISLPPLGAYGGGAKGIFGVCPSPPHEGMDVGRGRTFYWGEDSPGLMRLIEARRLTRTPYVLEPALAASPVIAQLWADITGSPAGVPATVPVPGPVPAIAANVEVPVPAAAARTVPVNPRYDLARTRGGHTVPGTAGVRQRLDGAVETGTAPVSAPALTAEQEAQLREYQEQRQRSYFAAATDASADLPAPQQEALRRMLAAPGGVSIRQAAGALSIGRDRVHRQFLRWRAQGTAEVRGDGGRARRWQAAAPAPAAADDASEGTP